MSNPLNMLAVRLHQAVMEPAMVLFRRASRLRAFGMTDGERVETRVAWHRPEDCRAPCPLHADEVPKLLRRYAAPSDPAGDRAARIRLTPMVIDLDRLGDFAAFERVLKERSSRTLSKIRRAQRMGYSARQFMLASHVDDLHAIKTSMAFRAAGPVIDRWLLKPHHVGRPATETLPVAAPCCPVHWTIWWGIFAPEPGHKQGEVETAERLVAYVKMMRLGDVVHYTEIMGHSDRLADGVMMLLHHQIVRWLIDAPEPAARDAHILLYGAAEHGGDGLLTWKKRAGFRPAKLRVAPAG